MGIMRDIPLEEKFGKLKIIREVDPEYHANGKISEKAYNALETYTVEITD